MLRRPSAAEVAEFLSRQADLAFSYADVGATRSSAPDGYNVDHNRIKLGEGEAAFTRAVASVRRWEMFNIGWVTLCWPEAPIEIGQVLGILSSRFPSSPPAGQARHAPQPVAAAAVRT